MATATVSYYSITINRAIDKNTSALLSSLTASGQSMTPTFDKNVTSYKITVANDVDSIKINVNRKYNVCYLGKKRSLRY